MSHTRSSFDPIASSPKARTPHVSPFSGTSKPVKISRLLKALWSRSSPGDLLFRTQPPLNIFMSYGMTTPLVRCLTGVLTNLKARGGHWYRGWHSPQVCRVLHDASRSGHLSLTSAGLARCPIDLNQLCSERIEIVVRTWLLKSSP